MANTDPSTRQLPRATVPDSNSWYKMTTAEAGDSNCLFAIPNVDGSGPYPVRFKSCDPLGDDSLWQFVPDSQGHYFIYNKGWGSSGHRLDINCPDPSMCIMWMGPSGEIYNNQRWFLVSGSAARHNISANTQQGGSNGQFQISSLGLPGSFMSSELVNNNYVSLMLKTAALVDDSKNWKLSDNVLTPSPSTTPASSTVPASSATPASAAIPTSAATPVYSVRLSLSASLSQPDAPSVPSTSPQSERPSSTLTLNTLESDNAGMSSTGIQHERQSTTLASDTAKSSNTSVSSTADQIGGPSASDTPKPNSPNIAKIVAPSVIGGLLLLLACVWWWRRRQLRNRHLRDRNKSVRGSHINIFARGPPGQQKWWINRSKRSTEVES